MSHFRAHRAGREIGYDYDELGLKTDDEYYSIHAEKENNDYEEDEFM